MVLRIGKNWIVETCMTTPRRVKPNMLGLGSKSEPIPDLLNTLYYRIVTLSSVFCKKEAMCLKMRHVTRYEGENNR